MRKILKVELQRAFTSSSFLIAVGIGILIVLTHVIREVLPYTPVDLSSPYPPLTPFHKWIGIDAFSFESSLLYLILPLLATLPFTDSYLLDLKSGFLKSIYTKVSKTHYAISKFIATFLVGGTAIALPLLIHLLIVSVMLPSVHPDPTDGTYKLIEGKMWVDFFYAHPYGYILSYTLIDFLYAGMFATLGLAVSVLVRQRFVVLLCSFLLSLFLFFTLQLLDVPQFIPFKSLQPGQTVLYITEVKLGVEFLLLFVPSVVVFMLGAVKRDTF